jgi:hypothetical protein
MPTDMYQRLATEASRLGKLPQVMVLDWLSTRLVPPPSTVTSDRTQVREILRAAGLLSELGPVLQRRADPTISLDEVIAELDQAGGKPLSEIIMEQRSSREW